MTAVQSASVCEICECKLGHCPNNSSSEPIYEQLVRQFARHETQHGRKPHEVRMTTAEREALASELSEVMLTMWRPYPGRIDGVDIVIAD